MAETPANVLHERWKEIVAKAWADKAFRQRLLADPAAVLKEQGLQPPPGVQLRVVENTDTVCHLVLPPEAGEELSDAELEAFAGGARSVCFVPQSRER